MKNNLKVIALLILVVSLLTVLNGCSPNGQQNHPPVADAGPDQTVKVGDTVTLNGTYTDPDGDPCDYARWLFHLKATVDSTAAFSPDNEANPVTFVADKVGEYHIYLQVSDGTLTNVDGSCNYRYPLK